MERIMREMIEFMCDGSRLIGTLDQAEKTIGLLIVSGGNEIRCGAHGGQAEMAAYFSQLGYPVFRYDRRGIGDSEGENLGYLESRLDIQAAADCFRKSAPHVTHIIGFGNCDAATALALFGEETGLDALILTNPWTIETALFSSPKNDSITTPTAAAIRTRYLERIKNPRSLLDLVTGKVSLRKLTSGLIRASKTDAPNDLAIKLAAALSANTRPITVIVAKHDTTAMAFLGVWKKSLFDKARSRRNIRLETIDSASHSFADSDTKTKLYNHVTGALLI
jgi:exosortase A-associated hydrolase 1